MNFLFYDMGSYTYKDVVETLLEMGHSVKTLYYSFENKYEDSFFEERFALELRRDKYDAVISINFFPLVAKLANETGLPYISWSYDSPLEEGFEAFFAYRTNHIFLFDREEVVSFQRKGFDRVFHLPLAVNLNRVDTLSCRADLSKYICDISFMGSLYKSDLPAILSLADGYTKGYVEAILQAQMEIYGANIVDKTISSEVVNRINNSFAENGQSSIRLDRRGLSFAISKHLTNIERTILLNELSHECSVNYYGYDGDTLCDDVRKHGPLKYFTEMNHAFRGAKVNLCPTLRSISSGIPLRALDTMAAGGFLLSNYQPELAEHFVDGESVAMYESLGDAFEKAAFYVENDEARKQITANGRLILEKCFSYKSRIEQMLITVFGGGV